MFTLPPRPPKDYALADVYWLTRSGDEFDPLGGPRITQTSLGKFVKRVEYEDSEIPNIPYKPTNPKLLERWANKEKAWWVTKPGVDDKFIHDVFRKYNISINDYDTRYKILERVFQRPFYYEFECAERRRLQKLRNKVEQEYYDYEQPYQKLVAKQIAREKPKLDIIKCKQDPPFWWKDQKARKTVELPLTIKEIPKPNPVIDKFVPWHEESKYNKTSTFCERRENMQLFNQPFRSEACNFYYEHYPLPKLKFRPPRF